MKSKDMRALPLEDLQGKLDETVKNLYHLRVKATLKELSNTAQLRQERKDVARLKQAIAEKNAASAKQESGS